MNHIDLTQKEAAALEAESIGEKIELIIQRLPPEEVTLNDIMDIVGVDSLMLLSIFLALIFLVPISIPGVSTVFGLGILFIGITRLFARKLWLPDTAAKRNLSSERLRDGFTRSLVWFHRLEKISHPRRMPALTSAGLVTVVNNLFFILAAVLLMAPFGFIPFSNTLPALALIFLAVGMMQRDGGSILFGYLFIAATIIYFGFLIALGGLSIQELFRFLN